MSKYKYCRDHYGEKLKVGDEVIPIHPDALNMDSLGIISKIIYNEPKDEFIITISDKEGNIVFDNEDPFYFTTKERFRERKQKYVYSLSFIDDELLVITNLPITDITNIDYEVPENACLVTLNAEHLTERVIGHHKKFCGYTICHYILEGDIKLRCDKKDKDLYYLSNDKGDFYPINTAYYKLVENKEELRKQVRAILEYFKASDLSHVNNNIIYNENEEGKAFEEQLVRKLKKDD